MLSRCVDALRSGQIWTDSDLISSHDQTFALTCLCMIER